MQAKAIVFITGVAGSGKTTVGKLVSEKTGLPFYDGDDFHPEANIEKMKAGKPLTDEDRLGWLLSINKLCREVLGETGGVIACSALKENYRTILVTELVNPVKWVLLEGDKNLIAERIKSRKGHFFSETLLQSQLDILERSNDAMICDVTQSSSEIADRIVKELNL